MVQSAPALQFDHSLTWLIVLTAGMIDAFSLTSKVNLEMQKSQHIRKAIEKKEHNTRSVRREVSCSWLKPGWCSCMLINPAANLAVNVFTYKF